MDSVVNDKAIRRKVLSHKNEFIGSYQINLSKSKLLSYATDSLKYDQLMMHLNDDNTFSFNIDVPFILCAYGAWDIDGNELSNYVVLKFDGVLNSQVMLDADGSAYIKYPVNKREFPFVELLYFDKNP